ncbi:MULTISPECIES: helix-turn-helix domain-containing protein [Cyanophyceae]|uniref:helix-turn-helix domain-containing protein n=1 Tax=Cyanophyceae TaxID=3028117 RepID=UPI001682CF71|nr:helix-turn-helix domain-containing protein [Trichocoleus sp. FACHB-40]MBD2006336.1 helix-turn-helix domain-containing protein [Trichocoleus sp. FACHB-40]
MNDKEWISGTELACLLGISRQAVHKKAISWIPKRKRMKRGGGWEYHISSLPIKIQEAILGADTKVKTSTIDLSAFSLSALPKLLLADRRLLPTCSAVYFVIQGGTVLYIGKAINLVQRWRGHERWYQLKDREVNGTIYIAWLECDETKSLELIEAVMINLLNPALNERRITSVPKTEQGVRCRLKELMSREDPSLTVERLACETEIDLKELEKLFSNRFKKIDCSLIQILCDYFDCSIGELLVNERRSSLSKREASEEWISLSRLATILGVTSRSLQKKVKGQDWNPKRKRQERGGGWEYHISGLPEDIQCRISAVN